jgi:transcriptional regulator with XRE-family HTH domain
MGSDLDDSASHIGDEIRQIREGAGLTQGELASAIGRDVQTISRWERGERQPKASDVERVRKYLLDYYNRNGIVLGKTVPRDTMRVSEPTAPRMPGWFERRIDDTMLELARAGATNEQARYVRDLLRSEATVRFVLLNDDGSPRSAKAQEEQVRDLIEGLRFWIERSARIRAAEQNIIATIQPQTPGGAPIAPVIATQDPGVAKPNVAQPRGKKK